MPIDKKDGDREWTIEAVEEEERVEHGLPARKELAQDEAPSEIDNGKKRDLS